MLHCIEFTETNPIVFSSVLVLTVSAHFVLTQLLKLLICIGITTSPHPLLLLEAVVAISLCDRNFHTAKELICHVKDHIVEGRPLSMSASLVSHLV